VRSKKHETWQKILPDGTILQVRLSHKHGKDIPKALFHKMLKQAQMIEEDFKKLMG
jgi:transposase-like protein